MNIFLEYEITPIPQFLRSQFGKYYSNSLGNAIFWAILIWSLLHLVYENFYIKFLKRFALPYHVRERLLNSCWYLLFFMANFLYCKYKFMNLNSTTTFMTTAITPPIITPVDTEGKVTIEIPNYDSESQLINKELSKAQEAAEALTAWDFIFMSSFYFHDIIWEVLRDSFLPFNYLLLSLLLFFSYNLRLMGTAVSVVTTLSIAQMSIYLTRIAITLEVKNHSNVNAKRIMKSLTGVIFYATIAFVVLIYLATIPLAIAVPLVMKMMEHSKPLGPFLTFIILWGWLLSEIYFSPLSRLVYHWRNHRKEYPPADCLGTLMECTMFKPRDDIIYNLKMLKIEIKERQARMLARRKPKRGADMLVQTLRCMVAINRKIKSRNQQTDSSKSIVSYVDVGTKTKDEDDAEEKAAVEEERTVVEGEKAVMEEEKGIAEEEKTVVEEKKIVVEEEDASERHDQETEMVLEHN